MAREARNANTAVLFIYGGQMGAGGEARLPRRGGGGDISRDSRAIRMKPSSPGLPALPVVDSANRGRMGRRDGGQSSQEQQQQSPLPTTLGRCAPPWGCMGCSGPGLHPGLQSQADWTPLLLPGLASVITSLLASLGGLPLSLL